MFKEVSNNVYDHQFSDHGLRPEYCGAAVDDAVFGSDEFRMYAYKIRRCPRMRSHDWTECPYAHRGEKAQRRDPRRHAYAAVVCPAFRAGASCDRGDSCEFAHGVFEYWLHPSRYRTRACNSGRLCHRKVCFFAHTPDQLRRPDPRAAKLRRSGSAHYAYRARVTVTPSATEGDGTDVAAGAIKITDKSNSGDEDYSFEKFSEFLRSLRALKIGGDYHDHDGNDGDDDDDNDDGDGMVRPVVMMSSGLDVSTESDFDSTHVEWISELVK